MEKGERSEVKVKVKRGNWISKNGARQIKQDDTRLDGTIRKGKVVASSLPSPHLCEAWS
jgi:hypothetical protein